MSDYITQAFTTAYPGVLGGMLHSPTLADTDYSLSMDDLSYDLMRRDGVVAHAFEFRKHLAAGLEWHIEPASPQPQDLKVAAVIEGLLKRMKGFAAARFNLAEAVIQGEAWAGIRGTFEGCSVAGGPVRNWWYVSELCDIDKRRFRPRKLEGKGVDPRRPEWTWEIARFFPQRWEAIEATHYIHHTYGSAEKTLGRGAGLGGQVWHYWRDKVLLLKLWLQRLDRVAIGNLVAKVKLDADTRRDPNNTTRLNAWLTQLNKMRAGHVVVHDINDELEWLEATGNSDELRHAIGYFDDSIVQLCLGSEAPTGGGEAGGYAKAVVASDSMHTKVRFDHALLEETITRSILALMYRANYRTILAETKGVEPSGCPEFRLSADRTGDPLTNMQVLEKVLTYAPVRKDEFYAKCGLTPPNATDDVIEKKEEVQPQAFGPDGKPKKPGEPSTKGGPTKASGTNGTTYPSQKAAQNGQDYSEALYEAPQTPPFTFSPSLSVNMPKPDATVVNVAPASVQAPVYLPPANVVVQASPVKLGDVYVAAPQVTVENEVNVPEQEAPDVTVNVAAPSVTITPPPREKREFNIQRDEAGNITGAVASVKG